MPRLPNLLQVAIQQAAVLGIAEARETVPSVGFPVCVGATVVYKQDESSVQNAPVMPLVSCNVASSRLASLRVTCNTLH